MYAACQDLATSYPALGGLSDDALVGRLFQFLDEDGDGVLEVDEWVPGVSAVLNKKTPKATALADRIAQGNAPVQQPNDFSKVKKIGIIGAGVAGLQAANELRKAGFEVKIFEKSNGVSGVWCAGRRLSNPRRTHALLLSRSGPAHRGRRANYADFGLQVPREAPPRGHSCPGATPQQAAPSGRGPCKTDRRPAGGPGH